VSLKSKKFWRHAEHWQPPAWGAWERNHHPPWKAWHHAHKFHRWPPAARRKPGFLFLRFFGAFGFMVVLVLGGMAAMAFLLTRWFGGQGRMAVMVWFGGCGLSLALPLLAVGVAVLAFRRIATPLADVMAAADTIAEGDLSVRVGVPEHGPDDFGRLAESFNHMAEELQHADQQRRNLTADVAHELRTPLHVIQGNLEGVLDGVYEPTEEHIGATLEETRALARLVDDLRTLSLAEAGQLPLVWERVSVSELLADVSTSFSGQAEAAGIDLLVEIPDALPLPEISADAGRLDQVLSNLMTNALRHTPPGGTITLRAESSDGDVRILVSVCPTFSTASGAAIHPAHTAAGQAAGWGWPLPASWYRLTEAASASRAKKAWGQPLPLSCLRPSSRVKPSSPFQTSNQNLPEPACPGRFFIQKILKPQSRYCKPLRNMIYYIPYNLYIVRSPSQSRDLWRRAR
jgi:signal transduction histidine kinase